MIRINLLGSPKPKGKKGPAFSMPSFELGSWAGPVVQVAAVLAIAGALNFGYWYRLDQQKKSIESQTRLAEQKNHELADIKVRYLERQKQAEERMWWLCVYASTVSVPYCFLGHHRNDLPVAAPGEGGAAIWPGRGLFADAVGPAGRIDAGAAARRSRASP